MFAVRDLTLDELAQLPPLVRFEQLATITVGRFACSDWRLCRRAATPATTTSRSNDLNDGVSKLENCDHELVINPYCEG